MPTTYLSAKSVKAEFGGVCDMTLHRWLADPAMQFPRPIYIRNRRYFDSADIADFKERAARGAMRKPPAGRPS